jgi:transcriptional regulator with XRE-family HTH domain
MDARDRLRLWMERAHLNQRAAARLFEMHYTTLNQILSGRRIPALAYAVLIERHTGIAPGAWLPTTVGGGIDASAARSRKRKVA